MSDGPVCPFPAEHNRSNFSVYCVDGECAFHHVNPHCPHPQACDREHRCAHPKDNHEDWRDLNRGV